MVSYSLLEPNCGSSDGGAKSAGVLRAASIRVRGSAVSAQVWWERVMRPPRTKQEKGPTRFDVNGSLVATRLVTRTERSAPRSNARYSALFAFLTPAHC